jgi:cupin 2 domain-containing protein
VPIEIVSHRAHHIVWPTPHKFWYNQAWNEWVLVFQGWAIICLQDPEETLHLATGDRLVIAAHRKYRPTLGRILADRHSEWH